MTKKRIAVLGLGHVGGYIYKHLKDHLDVQVHGYDLSKGTDLQDAQVLEDIASKHDAVIAATPFHLNKAIATACAVHRAAYFDLTESNDVSDFIKGLNAEVPMVSQCGLAPGMVSVIANNLTKSFKTVKSIAIRVGALPAVPNNQMGYNLTWNTEGLINEYIHPCKAVQGGKLVTLAPLENQEPVMLDGISLEAANTSGGLGTLAETWEGRAESVTYKTLRYPGHWDLMRFLKQDLDLAGNFGDFLRIFNTSIPSTREDLVFVLIKATGRGKKGLEEVSYKAVIRSNADATAIQISTASGIMAVVDAWVQGRMKGLKGLIRQEDLPFDAVYNSEFSRCYWETK